MREWRPLSERRASPTAGSGDRLARPTERRPSRHAGGASGGGRRPVLLVRPLVAPVPPLRVADAARPDWSTRPTAWRPTLAGPGRVSPPPVGVAGPLVARRLDRSAPRSTSAIEQQRGEGRPLPGAVRRRLEPVLGVDLGAVRLHDGRPADELAVRLDAEAFTVGRDVFVRGQRDLTASDDGQEVLAHELSHVAQQHGGPAVVQRLPRPEVAQAPGTPVGHRGAGVRRQPRRRTNPFPPSHRNRRTNPSPASRAATGRTASAARTGCPSRPASTTNPRAVTTTRSPTSTTSRRAVTTTRSRTSTTSPKAVTTTRSPTSTTSRRAVTTTRSRTSTMTSAPARPPRRPRQWSLRRPATRHPAGDGTPAWPRRRAKEEGPQAGPLRGMTHHGIIRGGVAPSQLLLEDLDGATDPQHGLAEGRRPLIEVSQHLLARLELGAQRRQPLLELLSQRSLVPSLTR